MRARYYHPTLGRFLQEDVYQGDGLNLYAYCGNNPVTYYDPSGYGKNDNCPPGSMKETGDNGGTHEDSSSTNKVFPDNPDNLLPEIQRDKVVKPNGTTSQILYTSDNIRIRAEQHPLFDGETYNPRHHGVHYHIEYKIDSGKSWNNKNNVVKVHPRGYKPGLGTGFIPGEVFPGQN